VIGLMMDSFQFEASDALLVIDVINDFEHEDGDRLFASFTERCSAMTATLADARAAAIPVVYVNDDHDRWDSNAAALVKDAVRSDPSRAIVESLAPQLGEHFLLKHRYSAFDHTPLDLLLERLHVDRLVLIGAATEGCIVQTAIDAREYGLKTTILADACASTDSGLEETALKYAEEVVGARISLARRPASRPRAGAAPANDRRSVKEP
jgi:nicotinamidase-related amidase